jgi:hypothetical protein
MAAKRLKLDLQLPVLLPHEVEALRARVTRNGVASAQQVSERIEVRHAQDRKDRLAFAEIRKTPTSF